VLPLGHETTAVVVRDVVVVVGVHPIIVGVLGLGAFTFGALLCNHIWPPAVACTHDGQPGRTRAIMARRKV
jgi:hypothetical protein